MTIQYQWKFFTYFKMEKIIRFLESISVSRYIKKKQLINDIKEKRANFEFDKSRILQLLLQDKTTEESIRLFDAIELQYFEAMKKRKLLSEIEGAIIQTNLKKHNKITSK